MLHKSAAALLVAASTVSAGTYSGPQDTANSIDPAIAADDARFVAWANGIDASKTYFAPRGSTAVSTVSFNSLGDLSAAEIAAGASPGYLTVTFDKALRNGTGADFAVFENGFLFGAENAIFAELAYVEVSTNGTTFARFASVSTNTGPVEGTAEYGGFDTTNIYNLAGKHTAGFGTPFDLSTLAANPAVLSGAVDLQNINYVKLVDIPGSGAFKDSLGNAIVDNWLTTGTGGFDFRLPEGQGIGAINVVPEPAMLGLAAFAALGLMRRRRA